MSSRALSRKLMRWGVALAVVGIAFTVYSVDILAGFGLSSEQGELINLVSAVSRILMFFGLPLSAGLLCLAIALRHASASEGQETHGGPGVSSAEVT